MNASVACCTFASCDPARGDGGAPPRRYFTRNVLAKASGVNRIGSSQVTASSSASVHSGSTSSQPCSSTRGFSAFPIRPATLRGFPRNRCHASIAWVDQGAGPAACGAGSGGAAGALAPGAGGGSGGGAAAGREAVVTLFGDGEGVGDGDGVGGHCSSMEEAMLGALLGASSLLRSFRRCFSFSHLALAAADAFRRWVLLLRRAFFHSKNARALRNFPSPVRCIHESTRSRT